MKKNKRAIAPLKFRTPDPEEETMTPFFVFFMIPFSLTFIIPHLNSGRNLDAAEIHGENAVAFVVSSQLPELATVTIGKNVIHA